MNYDMKRSGAYIQTLRVQNGYTQNELAQVMKVSQSFLSRIEAGEKGCSVDLFIQLSELFHVSIDALILGQALNKPQETERKVRLKADMADLISQLAQLTSQI